MKKSGPKVEPGIEGIKPRTLSLDDTTMQMLLAIGDGKISRGARRAARIAYAIQQATPTPTEGEPPCSSGS